MICELGSCGGNLLSILNISSSLPLCKHSVDSQNLPRAPRRWPRLSPCEGLLPHDPCRSFFLLQTRSVILHQIKVKIFNPIFRKRRLLAMDRALMPYCGNDVSKPERLHVSVHRERVIGDQSWSIEWRETHWVCKFMTICCTDNVNGSTMPATGYTLWLLPCCTGYLRETLSIKIKTFEELVLVLILHV